MLWPPPLVDMSPMAAPLLSIIGEPHMPDLIKSFFLSR